MTAPGAETDTGTDAGMVRATVGEGHQPVTITAALRTGVCLNPPYGLDLAGLLATRMRRQRDGQRAATGPYAHDPQPDSTVEDPADLDLPLSIAHDGRDWSWLASCAILPDPLPDLEPRFHYRVSDTDWASRAAHRPLPQILPSAGSYRDMMLPAPVLPVTTLTWRAVGDPAAVAALLDPVWAVGKRRATGEGRVLGWQVTPGPAGEDPLRWAYVGQDGQILRPIMAGVAEHLGVDYELGWYARRPPSWHPDRLAQLAMTPPSEDWDFADGWD